jgi:outer membrane protein/S-layer protein transport system outer membrane protein
MAHAVRAETLADVVAYAYQTNPGLQAQRASLRALDESYVQARGGYGLNISASVGESSYAEGLTGAQGTQQSYANTDSETLALVQPLYTGGKVHSQLSEAKAGILAGREELRRAELDLLQRVVAAYVDVLRDEALLKINEDTVAVLQKEVADIRAKLAVREVTMTDVAEAEARFSSAGVDYANAQAALNVSRAQFVSVVGQSPGKLAPPPPIEDLPADVDKAFDSAENNNPQLLSAIFTEQRSRARIAEAKAAGRPSVNAQVDFQHTPFLPYTRTPYNNDTAVSITLNQPLFTGGEISSGVRQAVETNDSDRLTIDDVRRQVVLSVSSSWEQLVTARRELSSLETAVRDNEFSFYGNREEAKLALRTTIEVLNAELELTSAQQSLVRTRASEYLDRIQLLTVMGVLTPKMLSPNVSVYDAADNFRRVEHKGETPLEWPARALDALGAPKIGPLLPTSTADIRTPAAPLPPTPALPTPIRSILSTLDAAPPEPK